jgi:1-acyl-sn-glycerol-3-phosphate acyltransferase
MKLILSHVFSPVYYAIFGLLLLVFHPVQYICLKIGGYQWQKKSVDILNFFLLNNLRVVGSRIRFIDFDKIPENRPVIIVSNHQSNMDIPPVVWGFRKIHPKFISKIELQKGIPSISFNLRHGGSAIIDRKNAQQSVREIFKLGKLIEEHNYAACIFPEGSRSKNGQLKPFKESGIKTLLKAAPSAVILPLIIQNHNLLLRYGKYPLSFGEKLRYKILDPIETQNTSPEELIAKVESLIRQELKQ